MKRRYYLISKSRTEKKDIRSIEYRGGRYPGGFTVYRKDGSVKRFGKENYELIDLLFLEKTCSKCRYYISPQADLALGDAWVKNMKKSTVIVVNTESGRRIIKNMYNEGLLTLYDLKADDLERMHRHNLRYKEKGHPWFMKFIIVLFNNKLARRISPFILLGFLSKIRRGFTIGIDMNLARTKVFDSL